MLATQSQNCDKLREVPRNLSQRDVVTKEISSFYLSQIRRRSALHLLAHRCFQQAADGGFSVSPLSYMA
jgi:hypothetical protein